MATDTSWEQLSTKELVLYHLRKNRGREIPVSEIRDTYNKKRTAISNAIKELQLSGLINIQRRPLRRGRYTIIWLTGDQIIEEFIHPDEVERKKESPDLLVKPIEFKNLDDTISYLISPLYDHVHFHKEIKSLELSTFELATSYFQHLMYEVGTKWENGFITTGQEHLISSRVEKIIYEFIPKTISKKYKGTILLLPVEGETHNMNLLILEMLLADSFKIINLRRSLPIRSLIRFIEDVTDDISWIFISTTLTQYSGTLDRLIKAIRLMFPDQFKIAVGGQAADSVRDNPGVDNVITSIQQFASFLKYIKGE